MLNGYRIRRTGNYILGDFYPEESQLFEAEAISECRNALRFICVLIDQDELASEDGGAEMVAEGANYERGGY